MLNIINQIKDYTLEILDEKSDVNVYTTISKLYRVEKNIEKIIKESRLENIDLDALDIANYVLNIEQATTKVNTFNFKESENFSVKRPCRCHSQL